MKEFSDRDLKFMAENGNQQAAHMLEVRKAEARRMLQLEEERRKSGIPLSVPAVSSPDTDATIKIPIP